MRITSDDSHHGVLSPLDDDFHRPDEQRWYHETSWFWWFVPEHRLGGWFYNWVRPNVGTSGGGAWVWDDTTFFHMEVPYYACYSNLRLQPDRDLRDFTYPSGVSVRAVEPLMRYRLGYRDRDLVDIDLEFAAVMPPWVGRLTGDPAVATHLDQVGRVTGRMVLRGRDHEVDCLAIRDRTWSPRPERWKDGKVGYCNACNGEVGFLAQSAAGTRGQTGDRVHSGYFVKDGRRAAVVDGVREIERDPEHGFLRRITVEAEDGDGRRFMAVGTGLSRMAMPIPGVHGVVWTSLVDWVVDGQQAWGEDQDAWPLHGWATFRRAALEGR
ncbi:MAG TPA: hypothetical protein VKB57_01480 [Acidimicrobiales bacterium]|nr:hypothetical protein [Acidimicrobiales bacterium]